MEKHNLFQMSPIYEGLMKEEKKNKIKYIHYNTFIQCRILFIFTTKIIYIQARYGCYAMAHLT